jgi:hypothetical protein
MTMVTATLGPLVASVGFSRRLDSSAAVLLRLSIGVAERHWRQWMWQLPA